MNRSRRLPAALVPVVVVALAGCAGPGGSSENSAAGPVFAHVHGLGVDPADGAVYVASHDGLFRSGPAGLVPAGAAGRDLMGFTIAGPGTFLSSGHPAPGDDLPQPLGLVESRDGGVSWTPLSLTGEVDFHALEAVSGAVFGYDATNGLLRVSVDGGSSWEDRAALEALDIAVDPADPDRVLATVAGGVASQHGRRANLHRSDRATTGVPVVGAGRNRPRPRPRQRRVQQLRSREHLATGRSRAVTAVDGALLAATTNGVFRSEDGGVTFSDIG